MEVTMLYLQLFIAFCAGALLTWAVCFWCTRSASAMARKARAVLDLGGPDNPPPPPPP
jgi:hypothetical protein